MNARAMMTDEVLAAEASRYDYFPAIFGGDRDIFSSTPSRCDRALVVGGVSGSKGVDNVEGVGFQAPLCVVLTDGSPWVMDTRGKSLWVISLRLLRHCKKGRFLAVVGMKVAW